MDDYHPLTDTAYPQIIDIRRGSVEGDLLNGIKVSLEPSYQGLRRLPTLLLWDEKGLKYFESITYHDSYYLTRDEIDILKRYSAEIAEHIQKESMLIELGSGNLRKIKILLEVLELKGLEVKYFALDVSRTELQHAFDMIPHGTFKHVRCYGLLGTYDDVRYWLNKAQNKLSPKCIISLGSSIGSFERDDAAKFLASFGRSETNDISEDRDTKEVGDESPHQLLIGLDACKQRDRICQAYNDPDGLNQNFILNALEHANSVLEYEGFKREDWKVEGKWDERVGSHDQYIVSLRDVTVEGTNLAAGSKILVVQSHKYDKVDRDRLWKQSRLKEIDRWAVPESTYGMLNEKPPLIRPVTCLLILLLLKGFTCYQQILQFWLDVDKDTNVKQLVCKRVGQVKQYQRLG